MVAAACASEGSGGDDTDGESASGPAGGASGTTSPVDQVDAGDSDDEPLPEPPDIEETPDVIVRNGDTVLTLQPWTACYGNLCYDGMPPEVLPDAGASDGLIIEFPEPGWEFSATATAQDDACERTQTEELTALSDTTHRLPALGGAGAYRMDVFGRGPGGDVIVSFEWETTVDGIVDVPEAYASILADHDGAVDSYGTEIYLSGLGAMPDGLAAQIIVTSSEGASYAYEASGVDDGRDPTCDQGSLFLSAPDEEGLAAAQLGTGPFTYEIELVFDGALHTGVATWPGDEDPECAPCVPLSFDPPLPGPGHTGEPAAGAGGDSEIAADGGLTAEQIQDTWVFFHDPDGGDAALHSGTAEIRDGCLYVDDAVVVWHETQRELAGEVIEDVMAGIATPLSIGGGGVSISEGADLASFPSIITDRCPTDTIWYAAGG